MRQLISVWVLMLFLTACAPATNMAATAIVAPATETAAPTPTVAPTATAEMPTDVLPSPNGQFIARLWHWGVYDSPARRPVIDVLDKQGSLLWQIPYQGDVATFVPSPQMNIYGWSPDSADLYFYYSWSPDGGLYAFVWTGYDLQKIHVADGHVERVLPGPGMRSFAFSPDGTLIAYCRSEENPAFLYIRNLRTGGEKRARATRSSTDDLMVGNIRWSPDGQGIAFQTQTADLKVETFYLDTARMEPKLIKEYKAQETQLDGYIAFDGWTLDSKLRFYEYPDVIAIDPLSGKLVIVGTPTPGP